MTTPGYLSEFLQLKRQQYISASDWFLGRPSFEHDELGRPQSNP